MSRVLRRDVLFYAGGDALARYGRFTRVTHPAEDIEETFTRSGAVGPYTDRGGKLLSAEANVPRVEWLDTDGDGIFDTPALLSTVARINLVDSDDISAWSTSGTPVVTGSISDPAGGTGAYRVADDDGAGLEFVLRNITFTGDAAKALAIDVREATMASSGVQVVKLRDNSAGADRLVLSISAWTDGEPVVTASTGTYLGKRYVGNGYWRLYARSTSVTASNTNRVEIQPAATASATGSIDVYRVNAYNATEPAYSILDASETKADETWYADYLHAPQTMTAYVKGVAFGSSALAASGASEIGVLHIGDGPAFATDPRFHIRWDDSGGFPEAIFDNGDGFSLATNSAAPTYGQVWEIRAVIASDGTVTVGSSYDEGTEEVDTGSAPDGGINVTAWDDTRIYVNSLGESRRGLDPVIAAVVAAGVYSMAEMREVLA